MSLKVTRHSVFVHPLEALRPVAAGTVGLEAGPDGRFHLQQEARGRTRRTLDRLEEPPVLTAEVVDAARKLNALGAEGELRHVIPLEILGIQQMFALGNLVNARHLKFEHGSVITRPYWLGAQRVDAVQLEREGQAPLVLQGRWIQVAVRLGLGRLERVEQSRGLFSGKDMQTLVFEKGQLELAEGTDIDGPSWHIAGATLRNSRGQKLTLTSFELRNCLGSLLDAGKLLDFTRLSPWRVELRFEGAAVPLSIHRGRWELDRGH
jgi:hypothetical protein